MQGVNQRHNKNLQVSSHDRRPSLESIAFQGSFYSTSNNKQSFNDLYNYSLAEKSNFWTDILLDSNLIYAGSYTTVVDETLPIDAIPRWFDGITMNFAENLLYSRVNGDNTDCRGNVGKEDGVVAVTEIREGNTEVRHFTWADVRKEAGLLASALQASGVRIGDRVILVGSNSFRSLVVFLATAWVGAVFSSSSTDMGTKGILERSVQINPKVC